MNSVALFPEARGRLTASGEVSACIGAGGGAAGTPRIALTHAKPNTATTRRSHQGKAGLRQSAIACVSSARILLPVLVYAFAVLGLVGTVRGQTVFQQNANGQAYDYTSLGDPSTGTFPSNSNWSQVQQLDGAGNIIAPSNWSVPAGVSPGDDVVIDGFPTTDDASYTLSSLTLLDGGTISMNGGLALAISGIATIGDFGSISIPNGSAFSVNGPASNAGSTNVYGNATFKSLTNSGPKGLCWINVFEGGTFSVSGATSNASSISVDGSATFGSLTNTGTGWITTSNGSTLAVNGSLTNSGFIGVSGNAKFNAITNNGELWVQDGNAVFNSPTTTNGGTVEYPGGGSLDFLGNSNAGGSTFNFNGGTGNGIYGGLLYLNGTASAGTGTFNFYGGTADGAYGSWSTFHDTSTAASGMFNLYGGTANGANGTNLYFYDTSSAGSSTFNLSGATVIGEGCGVVYFNDTSSGGSGKFTLNGSTVFGGSGSRLYFANSSNAGTGSIYTINGGAARAPNSPAAARGWLNFGDTSSAGSATFYANGGTASNPSGGKLDFNDTSTAGSATLVAYHSTGGGQAGFIQFLNGSTGGTASVTVDGSGIGDTTDGTLDISLIDNPSVSIGSLEGGGVVNLGTKTLAVGSSKPSATFSGSLNVQISGNTASGNFGHLAGVQLAKAAGKLKITIDMGTTDNYGNPTVPDNVDTFPIVASNNTLDGNLNFNSGQPYVEAFFGSNVNSGNSPAGKTAGIFDVSYANNAVTLSNFRQIHVLSFGVTDNHSPPSIYGDLSAQRNFQTFSRVPGVTDNKKDAQTARIGLNNANIIQALEEDIAYERAVAHPGDILIFYINTHGTVVGGVPILWLGGASANQDMTAATFASLFAGGNLDNVNKLFVIDACDAGNFIPNLSALPKSAILAADAPNKESFFGNIEDAIGDLGAAFDEVVGGLNGQSIDFTHLLAAVQSKENSAYDNFKGGGNGFYGYLEGYAWSNGPIPNGQQPTNSIVGSTATDFIGIIAGTPNADLSSLSLGAGALSPVFSAATTAYGASVDNLVTSITVAPTVASANSTVTVNGITVASGAASGPINLNVGGTIITVTVTAQDGVTTQTYTVAINAPLMVVQQPGGGGLTSGSSVDFGTVLLGTNISQTFTIQNAGVVGLTLGAVASSGDFSVTTNPMSPLAPSGNTSFTVNFAPGGVGLRTGTVTIASNDLVTPSFTLSVTGTGTPATTATATAVTTVSGTLNGTANPNGLASTAYFQYGTTTSYGSKTASQNIGGGSTAVSVSANLSGLVPSTTLYYQLVVTNSEGTFYGENQVFSTLPSSVATLSKLIISAGTLSPAFASVTNSYSASVANGTTLVTVTPTATQAQATVQVNGTDVASGAASGPINLNVGGTVITVVVTAQDGTTTQTYAVAVNAPLIVVQQPPGTGLSGGAASRDFGGAVPGKTVALVFTVKNSGDEVLNGLGISFDGANPGDFSVTKTPAASVAPGGSTTFTVTFTPGTVGARSATLHLASNDLVNNPFNIALTGTGAAMPAITTSPASSMVAVGQTAPLTVTATGGALSYQWLKNGLAVAGATSSSYGPAATTGNAGAYTVKVSNAAGSVTSSVAANLGVVTVVPASLAVVSGSTITLTASAAGPGISYQWQKNGAQMNNGKNPVNSLGVISGVATPKLTITKAVTADADNYTCLMTMPDPQNPTSPKSLASGVFIVKVTVKPVLDTTFTPSTWIVGGTVSDVITAQNSPTAFTLTGQPAGVTIDASGHFHGKPTVAITALTKYHLVISASNAAGAALLPVKVDVTVNPLPADAVGTFNGLVDRDATLSKGYGGSLNIASLSTGIFSGKLTLGALSYSFSAQHLDATVAGVTTPATVTIARALPLHNLTLALTFHHDMVGDAANVGKVDGTVTDVSLPGSPVNLLAWRSAPPPAFATIYTAALEIDPTLKGTADPNEAHIVYPQGDGFGTLTVTTAGAATWSGRMSDGTATTASVTMGPHGEVPLHFMLYTNTGSAHGWVQASGTAPNLLLDNRANFTFDWMKNPQTAVTLNYKGGIPLHSLTVIGASYVKPTVASPLVLSIAPVTSGTNAQLVFSEGGLAALNDTGITPAVHIAGAVNAGQLTTNNAFRILGTDTANSVSLPNPNPATISLTISPTTGTFGGSFILHGDQDPTKSTTSLVINRTATFSGVCVTRGGGTPPFVKGVGYFLLPELQPYPGLSVTAAPLLSGQVLLLQGQ